MKKMDEEKDLAWLYQSGVNNTYTIMMRKDQAEKLTIRSISDLAESSKRTQKVDLCDERASFFRAMTD